MDVKQFRTLLTEDQQNELKAWIDFQGINPDDVAYAEFDRGRMVITVAIYLRDDDGKHFISRWPTDPTHPVPIEATAPAMEVRSFVPNSPPPHWKGH